MSKHIFVPGDLWDGRVLICYGFAASNLYTDIHKVGCKYTMYQRSKNLETKRIFVLETVLHYRRLINHNDLNREGILFYPYDLLSDKEKFVLELSGKVPERLL